jgi:hypothetical protein
MRAVGTAWLTPHAMTATDKQNITAVFIMFACVVSWVPHAMNTSARVAKLAKWN